MVATRVQIFTDDLSVACCVPLEFLLTIDRSARTNVFLSEGDSRLETRDSRLERDAKSKLLDSSEWGDVVYRMLENIRG